MSPRTARIIALATDLRRPLAAVAAECGVSRQHVQRLIRARAIRLHRMRLAARAPDTCSCASCGQEFRVKLSKPQRFCSPECWYASTPPERPESVGGRAYAARLDGHPWAEVAGIAGSVSAHAAKLAAKDYAKRRGLAWPVRRC